MYLAYKYVVLAIVIAQANVCSERLKLPIEPPIGEKGLAFNFVVMPDVIPIVDLGAAIDTEKYSFSYGDRHLFVARLRPFGDLSVAQQNELLSHQKSLITADDAYHLATNWLVATDVDVGKLEKTYQWGVTQRWFFSDHGSNIFLPVFYVRWGNGGDPKVEVNIDGRTKSLIELLEYDRQTYAKHSAQLVKDVDKLLAIPDEEFQKYSPTERSNLVVRFAMNCALPAKYSTNPISIISETNLIPLK